MTLSAERNFEVIHRRRKSRIYLFAAIAILFRRVCKVVEWFAAVLSACHGLARFDVRALAQSSRLQPTPQPIKISESSEDDALRCDSTLVVRSGVSFLVLVRHHSCSEQVVSSGNKATNLDCL
jgi:hypothetical protein